MNAVTPGHGARILSRRVRMQLSVLQESVREFSQSRGNALRRLTASRRAATEVAQREFWLEYSWIDQEYRAAVRRLAQFCREHGPPGRDEAKPPVR